MNKSSFAIVFTTHNLDKDQKNLKNLKLILTKFPEKLTDRSDFSD